MKARGPCLLKSVEIPLSPSRSWTGAKPRGAADSAVPTGCHQCLAEAGMEVTHACWRKGREQGWQVQASRTIGCFSTLPGLPFPTPTPDTKSLPVLCSQSLPVPSPGLLAPTQPCLSPSPLASSPATVSQLDKPPPLDPTFLYISCPISPQILGTSSPPMPSSSLCNASPRSQGTSP